jgi:hypothetical protein
VVTIAFTMLLGCWLALQKLVLFAEFGRQMSLSFGTIEISPVFDVREFGLHPERDVLRRDGRPHSSRTVTVG